MRKALAILALCTASAWADGLQPSQPTSVGLSQPGQLPGTTTNDNAAAGNVGEFVSSTISSFIACPTSANSGNLTTITLPSAGDWDVRANVTSAATSVTQLQVEISTTSAAFDDGGQFRAYGNSGINAAVGVVAPNRRFSVAASTQLWIIANPVYTGACTMGGGIYARRVR